MKTVLCKSWFWMIVGMLTAASAAAADTASDVKLPRVRVASVRLAFHNGEHNAFTDLVRFKGKFYLTFRSCPDGHMVHPTASIIILVSDDTKEWRQVHRFHVEHRDTRDPHFLVFRDKLFVHTGTWYSGPTTIAVKDYDLNKHLGYAAWSDDGMKWHSPVMLEGTFGHYIWRAAALGDKAYLCGRRNINFDITARGEGRRVQSLIDSKATTGSSGANGPCSRKRPATRRPSCWSPTAACWAWAGAAGHPLNCCGPSRPTPSGAARTSTAMSAVRC